MDKPLIQRLGCLGLALLGILIFLVIVAGPPLALVGIVVIALAVTGFFLYIPRTPKAPVREQQRQLREQQLAFERAPRTLKRIALARERRALDRLHEHVDSGNAVGETHDGYVIGVVENGAFVVFDFFRPFDGPSSEGLQIGERYETGGFVQRSELSWRRSTEIDPGTVVTVGESVTVLLMALEGNRGGEPRFGVWLPDDQEGRYRYGPYYRYRLSIRRAAWPEAVDRYQVGQIVPAVVTEVQREFALLKLPGPVLGRANRTDVSGHHRHGGRMEDVIAEGDVVPVKVTFVNHAFFRLNVSYREARAETSAAGSWVFDQQGRVMQVPAEASEAFPDECAAIETRYAARRELSTRPPF